MTKQRDVSEQLATVDIQPEAIAAMVRILHQNRVKTATTREDVEGLPHWLEVDWSAPWLTIGQHDPGPGAPPRFAGSLAERPPTAVVGSSDSRVDATTIAALTAEASAFAALADDDEKLVPHPDPQGLIEEALRTLGEVWPEAGDEVDDLIRLIVLVDAPD